eukprot:6433289-Alexandrium_andersonii.AAC.1
MGSLLEGSPVLRAPRAPTSSYTNRVSVCVPRRGAGRARQRARADRKSGSTAWTAAHRTGARST